MTKRKVNDTENDGMKLRSGKILAEPVFELPENLDALVDECLQDFKAASLSNTQHAKELLNLISKTKSLEYRFCIKAKIAELYDINKPENATLPGAAGLIARLLTEYPMYHDLLEKKIKNFDLESPLIGDLTEDLGG